MWRHYGFGRGRGFGPGYGNRGFGGRGPCWDMAPGRWGWISQGVVAPEEVKTKVTELLKTATKGPKWIDNWGFGRAAIINDNKIVGWIREDVELADVVPGIYMPRFNRTSVQLVKDGQWVGVIWIN